MTNEEFIILVVKMRETQKEYFKLRNVEYLRIAKDLERQVDNALKEFGRQKVIENANRQN